MHPAFSVIFLTTLIGAGQGLFLALVTAQTYSAVHLLSTTESGLFYSLGSGLALLLLIAGLIASVFHLGRPERAWRAATQWRTSWLSREVIALPAVMGIVGLYALLHFLEFDLVLLQLTPDFAISLSLAVGLLGAFLTLVLFVCTGMIYAAIKFLQEWATPLTVLNFILLGIASGFTIATAYTTLYAPQLIKMFAVWAMIFTLLAALTRITALIRNARLKPKITAKSAIGIRHPKIHQMAQGAMGGSFNTREYFHGAHQKVVSLVKWGFLVLAFLIPLALLSIGLLQKLSLLFFAAALVQYVGLIAERWFFFAQANHPQNIYYQAT